MKKSVHKPIRSAIVLWIACVIYMTGLAFLVPLLSLIFFPPNFFITPTNLGQWTLIAIALVVVSAIIIKIYKKSMGDTMHYLSYMTLIVGVIATIFTVVGKQRLIAATAALGQLEPVATGYIEYWAYFIPKVGLSIIIYLVIAAVFWIIGMQIKKKEFTIGFVRKIYGGRARIFK